MGMDITEAQAEVRRIYSGGWGGPGVSALVWLAAAVASDTASTGVGAAVLFIGGAVLIFPINLGLNWAFTRRADLPLGHPMRGLAMQTAATMSVVLLSLWMLSTAVPGVFFPLAMVAVGAHYFPFAHLYGNRFFLFAGAVQCVAGLLVLLIGTSDSFGAYLMAALLAGTAIVLFVRRDRAVVA